jgi:N-acetylglucosamine-6-sulfatase
MKRPWPRLSALHSACLALIACLVLSACGGSHHRPTPSFHTTPNASVLTPTHTISSRPNIVFVLTDDLALNLLRFMPHVQAMEQHGMTFRHYFVADSLCCPSRASIFTGNFPHDTHVFSNFGPQGGFRSFYDRGEMGRSFNVALQRAGYITAMMGKYLNGYLAHAPGSGGHLADGARTRVPATYVPPGWDEWDVAGWGYNEYNYTLNQDGRLYRYRHRPQDYLTDVMSRRGAYFIKRATGSGKPFFLELATFAPHTPATPAPRDARDWPGLTAPRTASFNRVPTNPPLWLADHKKLTRRQIANINRRFRKRAQSVASVDRMIGSIEATLSAEHVADNTYLVFSSDNGYHMGEDRLMPGKMTAFDTDIHVPLVVVGPGVPAGVTTGAMAENIDLAKTFAAIAGTRMPGDGRSLLPIVHGKHPRRWRRAVLIEHHGPDLNGTDPDYQQPVSGNPRTYEAMRTARFLYVEYDDGEREYYDLGRDPNELHNLVPYMDLARLAVLHRQLLRLEHCHTGTACWRAMHL